MARRKGGRGKGPGVTRGKEKGGSVLSEGQRVVATGTRRCGIAAWAI